MLREDAPITTKTSLSLSQEEEEEKQEEEVEEEEEILSDEDEAVEEEEATPSHRRVPRRPRRVTAAHAMAARQQRAQRVVVLAGPGQRHARSAPSTKEVFMTHLPDSPPRGILSRPTIFQFADARLRTPPRAPPSMASKPNTPLPQPGPAQEDEAETVDPSAEIDEQRPEVDESFEDQEEKEKEEVEEDQEEDDDEGGEASCGGPHAGDILASPIACDSELSDEEEEETSATSGEDTEDDDAEEERAYRELQATRARFEAEQLERDALRAELSSYVTTLATKCDTDGEKLVAFPRNFQQIVALMTSQDLTGSVVSSAPLQPSLTFADKDAKTWSQILIQNSLAKQHAFGTLDESEESGDGEGSLVAKIALKMARIRQLDAILEEKLGKNLYTSGASTTVKKTKRVNPQEPPPDASTNTTRRSVAVKEPLVLTSRSSTTLGVLPTQPTMNYIERNRQVLENGAKANLTRAEEQRVKRLLRGSKKTKGIEQDDTATADVSEPVEFRLEQLQQQEIEKLIADKRGVYTSAVVMALDDVPEDDETDTNEQVNTKATRKTNSMHETKRERIRRQRLQRIEEELAFLRDHEAVPILPDDDDCDDASDGCSSERSFMTTTSILSTTSTRSGVTRRQLDQFVAAEVTKAEQEVHEKASRDEISKLLRSLSHLPITTARPATTTVG